MKTTESSRLSDGEVPRGTSLQDIIIESGTDLNVSVRTAKAQLSGLLDLVENGREIVITSNGKPKARLVSAVVASKRRPFDISAGYTAPPWRGGPTADELIREDRDGRGW